MNVRFVVVSLLVMLWSGCTCAGCEKKVDAPPAPAVVDASVPVAKVEAPADAGERLVPDEVTMDVPPAAVLSELYAAHWHLALRVQPGRLEHVRRLKVRDGLDRPKREDADLDALDGHLVGHHLVLERGQSLV